MKLARCRIQHFRGIKDATLFFPDHVVLVGDNNVGKSTVFEAIDLVLGPDRLNRHPKIDEHDFHLGDYLTPAEHALAGEREMRKGHSLKGVADTRPGEN